MGKAKKNTTKNTVKSFLVDRSILDDVKINISLEYKDGQDKVVSAISELCDRAIMSDINVIEADIDCLVSPCRSINYLSVFIPYWYGYDLDRVTSIKTSFSSKPNIFMSYLDIELTVTQDTISALMVANKDNPKFGSRKATSIFIGLCVAHSLYRETGRIIEVSSSIASSTSSDFIGEIDQVREKIKEDFFPRSTFFENYTTSL